MLACIFLQVIRAANMEHLVNKSLPGIDPSWMKSNWYSGSYKVARNRGLHYLFIESERDKTTDPVILYMNGGPGGSSIILTFQGLGPVIIEKEGFTRNNKSWCRNSSVLLIDNPAGVGFSYAKRENDKSANDHSNAKDMLNFMIQFYSDFPEYKMNPLYLSGVSYGGIYAPLLAWHMHTYNLEKNLTGETTMVIPLKGFIVANAVTDYRSDPNIYSIEMLNAFNLIPQRLYEDYRKKKCKIPWTLLWVDLKLIPEPDEECSNLFIEGLLYI